jgi:hypothetical protein
MLSIVPLLLLALCAVAQNINPTPSEIKKVLAYLREQHIKKKAADFWSLNRNKQMKFFHRQQFSPQASVAKPDTASLQIASLSSEDKKVESTPRLHRRTASMPAPSGISV